MNYTYMFTDNLNNNYQNCLDLVKENSQYLENKTIIDIGSNIGLFTKAIAETVSYTHIHLFEPCKDYLNESKNLLTNFSNITYNNFAVSNAEKTETIYKSSDNIGWNTLYKKDPLQDENFLDRMQTETINTVILDEYYKNIHDVGFIKIDVEGYERYVLEGSWKLIEKFKPYILIEVAWGIYHPDWLQNKATYEKLFSLGYERFDLDALNGTKDILFKPIAANKKNNATLVTGLWNAGRGNLNGIWNRSFDFYIERFKELLKTDNNLIIFGDEELKKIVFENRSEENTQFILRDLSWYRTTEYYPLIQKVRNDPGWINQNEWIKDSPLGGMELAIPIYLSKVVLLNEAIEKSKFNTEYFYHVDGGTRMDRNSFTKEIVEDLTNYSNLFFITFPYVGNEVHGFNFEKIRELTNDFPDMVPRGTFFGGHKNNIKALYPLYYDLMIDTLTQGYMGLDESMFTILVYNYPELIDYYKLDENDHGDPEVFLKKFKETVDKTKLFQKVKRKTSLTVSNKSNINTDKNKLPISVGMLSWNSDKTLRNTLESYRKNGLLDLVNDITIVFQEVSDDDKNLANEYGIKFIGLNENIGISKAFITLAELAGTDTILFLEHDWELIEDKETTVKRLTEGINLLNNGFNVVKYRHRKNPGYPLYSENAYKGNELNHYDKPTDLMSPHLMDCIHWIENPDQKFSDKISKENNYFISTSRWSNFTNNPCMYKKNFYLDCVYPFKEGKESIFYKEFSDNLSHYGSVDPQKHSLEIDIGYWWSRQNFKVAAGEGLFSHNDIQKYGDTKKLPYLIKEEKNSIAFIFAHRPTDKWSTPLSIVNEFKRLGWKTEIYSLFDSQDKYVDDNIYTLLKTSPDIIMHMDWGQHTSPILNELRKTGAYCIMESGDDPQLFNNNFIKADWFDLILSPDIRSVEEYRKNGYNAEWWTHFSDTDMYFPLDIEPTNIAVCSRGKDNDAFMIDNLTKKISKIINQNGFYGSDHNKFLNSGHIVLQQSRYGEITRRIFEGMSCKKLVITDKLNVSTKIQELFTDGEDIIYYNNETDLLNKIIYYLNNKEELKRIAENGYNKVLNNHTQKQRVDFIINKWKSFVELKTKKNNFKVNSIDTVYKSDTNKNECAMLRTDIINLLIKKINAKKYLEIGVSNGINFSNIECDYKIGIDPNIDSPSTVHLTSDDFFKLNIEKFDVVFIDGLHHSDQVYRDIINSIGVLNKGGYIICHDMNPWNENVQLVPLDPKIHRDWTGDCWKAFVTLRRERSDLEMYVVDTDCGCGIIQVGNQQLIHGNEELTWENLEKNRKEWLNLISVENFLQKIEKKLDSIELSELLHNYISDPQNCKNNFILGKYYENIGQTASAVSYYIRAAERSADDLLKYECLLRASICFNKQGTRNFTVKCLLLHALSICPKRPEAYYLMSMFYEKEKKDGYWNESYTISSIGLTVSNFEESSLSTDVGYPGKYALIYQKAISSWWCGLCEDSRDLLLELLENYEMRDDIKQSTIDHLKKMGVNYKPFDIYNQNKFKKLKIKFNGAENIHENYSEAYQDIFVLTMLNGKRNGTYLEIGAGNSFYGNNTALLEKNFDWKGIALDISEEFVNAHTNERKNPCLLKDATKINYESFLKGLNFPKEIDYLQLDCDPPEVTYKILLTIPFEIYKFAVITYEHDYYCDETKSFQEKSKKYLESYGYLRILNNISPDNNRPYEDWWVHPDLIDIELINQMINIDDSTKKAEKVFLI